MSRMDVVYRMIEKECQRDSLVDLLGRWDLTENDWHTFMNGGLTAEDNERLQAELARYKQAEGLHERN